MFDAEPVEESLSTWSIMSLFSFSGVDVSGQGSCDMMTVNQRDEVDKLG